MMVGLHFEARHALTGGLHHVVWRVIADRTRQATDGGRQTHGDEYRQLAFLRWHYICSNDSLDDTRHQ